VCHHAPAGHCQVIGLAVPQAGAPPQVPEAPTLKPPSRDKDDSQLLLVQSQCTSSHKQPSLAQLCARTCYPQYSYCSCEPLQLLSITATGDYSYLRLQLPETTATYDYCYLRLLILATTATGHYSYSFHYWPILQQRAVYPGSVTIAYEVLARIGQW